MTSLVTQRLDHTRDPSRFSLPLKEWDKKAAKMQSDAIRAEVPADLKYRQDLADIQLGAIYLDSQLWTRTQTDRFYGAFVQERLQGIALVQSNTTGRLDIMHLITRPENVSNDAERVRGVGRAIICHILQEMTDEHDERTLHLTSTEQSTGFYEKQGFQKVKETCRDYQLTRAERCMLFQREDAPLPLPAFVGAEVISFLLPTEITEKTLLFEVQPLAKVLYNSTVRQERAIKLVSDMFAPEMALTHKLQDCTLEDSDDE